MRLTNIIIAVFMLTAPMAWANGSASLQFTVAAPDPVVAGDPVRFQTLVVNTGASPWAKGTYYWAGEVYSIDAGETKFFAQVDPITPVEDVPPGGAAGVQLIFNVPENFTGKRLLYRVFLVKDGKRLLETDYKGFQVIEKKFVPPPPQDFKVGGDVSLTYKNSSKDGWDDHQAITSANIVGKVKKSSFLFNTYIVHTPHKPITPTIVLLNFYAPWGTLSAGDIAPTLTPLSLDGQGMRGVSYERKKDRLGVTALVGRIVAPEEPTSTSSGRFARYTGGAKAVYDLRPNLKIALDSALSKDDEFSITIDSAANTLKPQQTVVYGTNVDWKFLKDFSFNAEYQMSSYNADLNSAAAARSGTGFRNEVKYKGRMFTGRAALTRVDAKFMSFASPSTIPDRLTYDVETGIYPSDWATVSVSYNRYVDNLENDPGKTTTTQTQMNLANTLRLFNSSMLTLSLLTNTAVGKPAAVQNNQTNTFSVSLTQPIKAHTVSVSMQNSDFKDKTGLSHDLNSNLISLNGSFRLSDRMSMSSGIVGSTTKDKVDKSSNKNNSLTTSVSYAMPARAMALQCWATTSANKNDSPTTPSDTQSFNVNVEAVWLKSKSSKFTFGVGTNSRTDKLNSNNNTSEINILTRMNYSF